MPQYEPLQPTSKLTTHQFVLLPVAIVSAAPVSSADPSDAAAANDATLFARQGECPYEGGCEQCMSTGYQMAEAQCGSLGNTGAVLRCINSHRAMVVQQCNGNLGSPHKCC